MNIYVGNLAYIVNEEDLKKLFEKFGELTSCSIIRDRYTNRSIGFGFVEIADKDAAENAITELNGVELKGRNIKVSKARTRESNAPRGPRRH